MLELKTYKNYKVLCEALGWDVGTSNTKKSQLKKLNTMCEYERKGHAYIIKRIKSNTQQLLVDEGTQKTDIELLIMDILYNSPTDNINLVSKDLFRELNIVNDNYVVNANHKGDYKLLSKAMGVDEDIIRHVFHLTSIKNNRMVTNALNSLQNKGMIKWEKCIMVCKRNKIKTPNGILYGNREYDFATKEEIDIISEVENKIKNEMDIYSFEIFNIDKKMKSIFEKKVNKELIVISDIEFYYYSYNIVFKHEHIKDELNKLTIKKKQQIKSRLNKNTLESILKTIENGYRKTKNKYKNVIGDKRRFILSNGNKNDIIRSKQGYLSKSIKVSKAIIKIGNTIRDYTNLEENSNL